MGHVEEASPRLLSFAPTRESDAPRDAATVLVLRDAGQRGRASRSAHMEGIEVFCVRRHDRSGYLGGAVVFPGGKVDPSDLSSAWLGCASDAHPRSEMLAMAVTEGGAATGETLTGRALAITACREALEEGGILPVDRPLGDAAIASIRRDLVSHPNSLAAALERRGLRLQIDALVPFARWITPVSEPRRFDTRFFLLKAPANQEGTHDGYETTLSFWATPADVLERASRGELFLVPPTTRSLEVLASMTSVAAAMALAMKQPLCPILPIRFGNKEAPFLTLPGDPAHPVKERRVAGTTRFVLRGSRFVSEDSPPIGDVRGPVALAPLELGPTMVGSGGETEPTQDTGGEYHLGKDPIR